MRLIIGTICLALALVVGIGMTVIEPPLAVSLILMGLVASLLVIGWHTLKAWQFRNGRHWYD